MRYLVILLSGFLLTSCSSHKITLRPEGSTARVTSLDGTERSAELLAITDSLLVCATDTVLVLPLSSVKEIEVSVDDSKGWRGAIVICQAIPSFALIASKDLQVAGAVGLTMAATTWIAYELTGPRVLFEQRLGKQDIDELRMHTRHPEGLTNDQLDALIQVYRHKKLEATKASQRRSVEFET